MGKVCSVHRVKNAHGVVVEKPGGTSPLERPRCGKEDKIKMGSQKNSIG
jgi:hypothetical protein